MIQIEPFYKAGHRHCFLRIECDSKEDIFIVDALLKERYRIVDNSINSVTLEITKGG
jgi:hypothetical protein